MPELRQDPVRGHWVIVSEERARRPSALPARERPADGQACPFCPGHESETRPEVFALRDAHTATDTPGWRVRVVPNRFPALALDAGSAADAGELFARRGGFGRHEVIVEGEHHTRSVTELSPERMREVVEVYRERFCALDEVDGLRSAVLIKNVGEPAGASLEHSHSQLIATPVLSPVLAAELDSARVFERREGGCIWCAVIAAELERGERIVAREGGLVALCPWAPRFPYETQILPEAHESHFEAAGPDQIEALAGLLQRVLGALEARVDRAPYNYAIHTGPLPRSGAELYHWRVSILPRLSRVAGYEQSTGLFINPVPPERAAAELRVGKGTGA